MSANSPFYVYDWLVEPAYNKLSRHQETQQLEPLAMEVLVFFAANVGEVISRDQLVEDVWQGRIVGDHAIYRIINQLRKVLNESGEEKYFQTIRKKGYRFIADVKPAELEDSVTQQVQSENFDPSDLNTASSNDAQSASYFGAMTKKNKTLLLSLGLMLLVVLPIFIYSGLQYSAKSTNALPDFSNVIPFTNLPGLERGPAFSSDGKKLAFSYRALQSEESHIYYQTLSDRKLVQVSFGDVRDSNPKFSPDNKKLVFLRQTETACEILIQDISDLDKNPEKALDCESGGNYIDFVWGPNGDEIFYTDTPSSIEAIRVYQRSLVTGKQKQLTNPNTGHSRGDLKLALSPDGKKLAIIRDYNWGDTNVFLLDLVSGKEKKLFRLPGWQLALSWSHDGNYLYYNGQKNTVDAYSLLTGTSHMVAKNIDPINYTVGSPVAHKIAVETGRTAIDIWQLDLEQAKSEGLKTFKETHTQPFVVSSEYDHYPAFANTSEKIAFVSSRSGVENSQIWIRDEEGSEFQLTNFNDGRPIRRLRWSPDDRYILSDRSKYLYTVDTKTGHSQRLMSKEHWTLAETASWSRDGQYIYFSSDAENGDWQIYRMAAKLNAPIEKVTVRGGYSAQESIDGKYLYFLKYYQQGLWRIPIRQGKFIAEEEVRVVEDIDVLSHDAYNLTADGVYYFTNQRQAAGIYFLKLEDMLKAGKERQSKRILAIEREFMRFTMNAAANRIAFPRKVENESAIVLMEAKVAPASR